MFTETRQNGDMQNGGNVMYEVMMMTRQALGPFGPIGKAFVAQLVTGYLVFKLDE